MRLRVDQLPARLAQGLALFYLLSGDEPLQLGEAAQWVRQRAREQGYLEREVLEVGADFDWREVAGAAASLSLLSDRRLIELRLASAKIGAEGSRAISELCARPSPDLLYLLVAPKLERGTKEPAWVSTLDRVGVVVQVWPLEGPALVPWLEQRLRGAGLSPESGVAALLAERVEGNLLAAAQEVEKLVLRYGGGPVSVEQVRAESADSARFDVFDLVDGMLGGTIERLPRILDSLRAEGLASAVVLWALARELRLLVQMATEPRRGPASGAGTYLSDKRRPLYRAVLARHPPRRLLGFLTRCSSIDRQIKGQAVGDAWEALLGLCCEIAGARPLPSSPGP